MTLPNEHKNEDRSRTVNTRVFVIAEAGVNHNGSLDMACELIDAAASAGADAVKFQTFRASAVISRFARKAEYQIANTGSEGSQLDMVRKLEFGEAEHKLLIEHCGRRGIEFMSTPFDLESVRLLTERFDLTRLKIPSGEITNLPLLVAVGRIGKPMILSTGMATPEEIEAALSGLAFAMNAPTHAFPTTENLLRAYEAPDLRELLRSRITLLHCTTEYPAPFEDVNLRAMDTLASRFGVPVGYSDHTRGIAIPVAAAARGAVVIEKHITLDRRLPGPDHVASIEPDELSLMVRMIRDVEVSLGDGHKRPMPSEIKNIAIARKSLVAARPVARGELYTQENLTTKRPGSGVSAMRYLEFLGRPAGRDYGQDELIEEG
jgi:N-acetylneuraminate synthase